MIDPTNPFHRASYYVEHLKYGPGPKPVERVAFAELRGQFDALLRDAGVEKLSPDELIEALEYYGRSWSTAIGLDPSIAFSIFADGVMHGIAYACDVEADPRPEDLPSDTDSYRMGV